MIETEEGTCDNGITFTVASHQQSAIQDQGGTTNDRAQGQIARGTGDRLMVCLRLLAEVMLHGFEACLARWTGKVLAAIN